MSGVIGATGEILILHHRKEPVHAAMSSAARQTPQDPQTGAVLVYDGECPFCSAYVRMVRIREAIGCIRLVDARKGGPEVDDVHRRHLDLNEGMVLKYRGEYFYGADCIHMMALLSTPSGWFNRINAAIFRSPRLSKILYPVLRAGRNLTLRLLGRTRI